MLKKFIFIGLLSAFWSGASAVENEPEATQAQVAPVLQAAPMKNVGIPAPELKKKRRPVLPGIETEGIKLNTTLTQANIIHVTGDGTENALISIKFPNRIATPFLHPRIIDKSFVDMQIDGSSIFLNTKTKDPFAIYITGDAPGDPVVSLTLLPRDIPPQTLILQLDSSSNAKRASKVESYTQQLVDLLRQVGSGRIPEGYSEGRMPKMMAKQEGLIVIPEVRYSGSWLDIYRYKIENDQSETIELTETQFYQKGVKAVAILPNAVLKKGDTTTIYIVADKSMLDEAVDDGK